MASAAFSQTLDDWEAKRTHLLEAGLGEHHPKIRALDAVIGLLEPFPPELTRNRDYMSLQEKMSATLEALRKETRKDAAQVLRSEQLSLLKRMNQIEKSVGKEWKKRGQ